MVPVYGKREKHREDLLTTQGLTDGPRSALGSCGFRGFRFVGLLPFGFEAWLTPGLFVFAYRAATAKLADKQHFRHDVELLCTLDWPLGN